jgi:hypothetical protein
MQHLPSHVITSNIIPYLDVFSIIHNLPQVCREWNTIINNAETLQMVVYQHIPSLANYTPPPTSNITSSSSVTIDGGKNTSPSKRLRIRYNAVDIWKQILIGKYKKENYKTNSLKALLDEFTQTRKRSTLFDMHQAMRDIKLYSFINVFKCGRFKERNMDFIAKTIQIDEVITSYGDFVSQLVEGHFYSYPDWIRHSFSTEHRIDVKYYSSETMEDDIESFEKSEVEGCKLIIDSFGFELEWYGDESQEETTAENLIQLRRHLKLTHMDAESFASDLKRMFNMQGTGDRGIEQEENFSNIVIIMEQLESSDKVDEQAD